LGDSYTRRDYGCVGTTVAYDTTAPLRTPYGSLRTVLFRTSSHSLVRRRGLTMPVSPSPSLSTSSAVCNTEPQTMDHTHKPVAQKHVQGHLLLGMQGRRRRPPGAHHTVGRVVRSAVWAQPPIPHCITIVHPHRGRSHSHSATVTAAPLRAFHGTASNYSGNCTTACSTMRSDIHIFGCQGTVTQSTARRSGSPHTAMHLNPHSPVRGTKNRHKIDAQRRGPHLHSRRPQSLPSALVVQNTHGCQCAKSSQHGY
jgi:hypothetical protein